MQLQNPFTALSPTVDADVLAELASVPPGRPHPLPAIVERTKRSRTGVLTVLERLVQQGVVLFDDIGGVKTYQLNREHLLAEHIVAISESRARFLARLRDACELIPVRYAALFGSAARGTMRPDSDIDLFFVVDAAERERADDRIFDLTGAVHRWTGNEVNPVVYDATAISSDDPLIAAIDAEGIPLTNGRRWLRNQLREAADDPTQARTDDTRR